MKKPLIITIISLVLFSLSIVVFAPFIVLSVKTNSLQYDYSYLRNDETYSKEVMIDNIPLKKQTISCGYACIEMLSTYYGKVVTEDDLSNKNNGGVSTQSSDGFLNEANESIPNHNFVKKAYLQDDEFLKEIHYALENKYPVSLEWAAKYEDEWTLHFSLIYGMNLKNDLIHILNPYGYEEHISVDEFISRSTFEAYENMPLFLNFGFAFNAFEKNTIFY